MLIAGVHAEETRRRFLCGRQAKVEFLFDYSRISLYGRRGAVWTSTCKEGNGREGKDTSVTNLTPLVIAWVALVLVIVCLAFYRRFISLHEDNCLHIDEAEAPLIPNQVAVFHKLEVVDRVGKALTVVAAAGGMALTALYLYAGWMRIL
jgi:hypothetical protein